MTSRKICAAHVRFWVGVPVLTGCLASCFVTMAPPQAPAAPPSPPVEASRSETVTSPQKASLALELRMYVERKGRKQHIQPGDQLRRGDYFELLIRPNQPAYVYLVQSSSTEKVSMLFPDRGDQLLPTEREYRLPPDLQVWYQVGGGDDEENLYLLMARDPIPDPKKLVPHVARPAAAPKPAALVTDSRAGSRQPASKPPQVPPLQEDVLLSVRDRTFTPVRKAGAVTATVPADGSDSDSILVRQLHFSRR
jgi:hypothetical protein